MKTAEREIGVILVKLTAHDLHLTDAVMEIQKRIDEIKLDALKQGMTLALEEIIKARDNKKEL